MAETHRDQPSERIQWATAAVLWAAIVGGLWHLGNWAYGLVAAVGFLYLSGVWFFLEALLAPGTGRRRRAVIACFFSLYVYGGVRLLPLLPVRFLDE